MWLITTFGFFSVVQKPGQQATGTLTVRGRVRADMDALRARYLPDLGPVTADAGTDYRYRAVAPAAAVAAAFAAAVTDVDYSNFKSAVAARQGPARAGPLHDVWATMAELRDPPPAATPADATAFGGVVFDAAGRVLLRRPAGERDGYAWTFPKGSPRPAEPDDRAAERQVRERTAVIARTVGRVPGTFPGGASTTAYFLMRRADDDGTLDHAKTEQVAWADPAEARRLIVQTRNHVGRRRDLDVLAAAEAAWHHLPPDAADADLVEHEILTHYALRFDGYKYADRTGFDYEAAADAYAATGRWPARPEERLTLFFMLQRSLLKWHGYMPLRGKHWRVFRSLFLEVYDDPIPAEYVPWEWPDILARWERDFRPRQAACIRLVRGIHERTAYDDDALPYT